MTFLAQGNGGIFQQGAFKIDPNSTPEMIQRKREMLAAMMPRYGEAKYVGQGIGQLAHGIMAGRQGRALDKFEGDKRAEAASVFNASFGGPLNILGMRNPSVSTTGAMKQPGIPTPRSEADQIGDDAMAAIGRNPVERDLLAKTLMAEAGGEGLEGMIAAGAVINNRVKSGGYGDGLEGVIMKPGQFSAWNGVTGYAGGKGALDMDNISPSDAAYQAADLLMSGQYEDPTGGATHYYNPAAADPAWGMRNGGNWTRIGNHVFGSADAGRSGGQPQVTQAQAPAGPDMSGLYQALQNPWLTPAQRSIITSQIQQAQSQSNAAQERYWAQQDPMYQLKLKQAQLDYEQDKAGSGSDNEFGLTPQYITDKDGNLRMIQLGKDGSVNEVKLPEGSAIQKGVEKLDLGTHYQWHNTITGEPIGQPIAKNNEQAAADTARGTAAGKAEAERQQNAPAAIAKAESAIALIDDVMNDPNLASITGMVQGRLPPMSQAGTDLNVKIEQIKGKAFLEAFESLKGGGQITEREGIAAQNAIARLQRAQSTEAYKAALADLKAVIQGGLDRARGGKMPEASSTSTGDFAGMPLEDMLNVDIMTLDGPGMDAYEARLKELGVD